MLSTGDPLYCVAWKALFPGTARPVNIPYLKDKEHLIVNHD